MLNEKFHYSGIPSIRILHFLRSFDVKIAFLGQNVSRVKVSGVKVSFEELGVKVSGVKVPLGSKCPGVKVSVGSKCL